MRCEAAGIRVRAGWLCGKVFEVSHPDEMLEALEKAEAAMQNLHEVMDECEPYSWSRLLNTKMAKVTWS